MATNRSAQINAALLAQVTVHPLDLTRAVADTVGVSRQAVATRVRALVDAGYLSKSGTTRPTYQLGLKRAAAFDYRIAGLAEDRVWTRDIAPLLQGAPREIVDICHFGLTEMVNNAIDHSEGTSVGVRIARDPERITIGVSDDGVGIFRKIAAAFELPDERLALLELSKGKLTTDPRRHSGEGVFFTSRMFDRYQILSGELLFDHDDRKPEDWLLDMDEGSHGTEVFMQIAANSTRVMAAVYAQYSSGPDDYAFAKTVVPVRLAKVGDENLVSRSQAKRLMLRVDGFRIVVLDFFDVSRIGQAFADEVFRVFANEHPQIELQSIHAVPQVQQMIRRAEVARDEENGVQMSRLP
jgi:anti-sigma regulatory factor (Ser/Thr protein kinase)/biotin operon repressor